MMDDRHICDLCGKNIPPHAHYVVRIDVFADPTLAPINIEEVDAMDTAGDMKKLLEHMKDLSSDDLQDMVARQFTYVLCRACQIEYLANPLGHPRKRRSSSN